MNSSFRVLGYNEISREAPFACGLAAFGGWSKENPYRAACDRATQLALQRLSTAADVFVLQQEHVVLKPSGSFSNVRDRIWISTTIFDTVTDLSTREFAIAAARHRTTGQMVTFAACSLFPTGIPGPDESVERIGRATASRLVATLQEVSKDHLVVVVADMKGAPEHFNQMRYHRFKVFADAGFEIARTGEPTSVFPHPKRRRDKYEMDFLFVRQPSGLFVQHQTRIAAGFSIDTLDGLGPSNRTPLVSTMTVLHPVAREHGRVSPCSSGRLTPPATELVEAEA